MKNVPFVLDLYINLIVLLDKTLEPLTKAVANLSTASLKKFHIETCRESCEQIIEDYSNMRNYEQIACGHTLRSEIIYTANVPMTGENGSEYYRTRLTYNGWIDEDIRYFATVDWFHEQIASQCKEGFVPDTDSFVHVLFNTPRFNAKAMFQEAITTHDVKPLTYPYRLMEAIENYIGINPSCKWKLSDDKLMATHDINERKQISIHSAKDGLLVYYLQDCKQLTHYYLDNWDDIKDLLDTNISVKDFDNEIHRLFSEIASLYQDVIKGV